MSPIRPYNVAGPSPLAFEEKLLKDNCSSSAAANPTPVSDTGSTHASSSSSISGDTEGARTRSKFSYTARSDDELSFERGAELTILSTADPSLEPGWWKASLQDGQVGVFPANYVNCYSDELEAKAHGSVTGDMLKTKTSEARIQDATLPRETDAVDPTDVEPEKSHEVPDPADVDDDTNHVDNELEAAEVAFTATIAADPAHLEDSPTSELPLNVAVAADLAADEEVETQSKPQTKTLWSRLTRRAEARLLQPPPLYTKTKAVSDTSGDEATLALVLAPKKTRPLSRAKLRARIYKEKTETVLADVGVIGAAGHRAVATYAAGKALKFSERVNSNISIIRFQHACEKSHHAATGWQSCRPVLIEWPGPPKFAPMWEALVGVAAAAIKKHAHVAAYIGNVSLYISQKVHNALAIGHAGPSAIESAAAPVLSLPTWRQSTPPRPRARSAKAIEVEEIVTPVESLNDNSLEADDENPRVAAPVPLPSTFSNDVQAANSVWGDGMGGNPLSVSLPDLPFRTVAMYQNYAFTSKAMTVVSLEGEGDAPFVVGEQIIEINSQFIGPGVNVHEMLENAEYPLYLKVITQAASFEDI